MFCPAHAHAHPHPHPFRLPRLLPAPRLLATVCAAAVLALGGAAAKAQVQAQQASASRMDRVTLYQGSATVERTLALAAGAREAVFTCLPAALDPQSLQAQGDGVRVGGLRVDTSERALVPECASAQDAGIRSVEDELAKVNAALGALQLADSYLKTVATLAPSEGGAPIAAPNPVHIQATAEALRRGLEGSQVRAHQLQRDKRTLEQRLRALQQEQGRSASAQSRVARVRVQLAAERAGTLRLVYQVRGPSWQSSYRATLDDSDSGVKQGSTASVRLERQATVAQSTGEDWSGVQLRLSTGAPQRAAQGQLPRPWVLDMAPPPTLQMARGRSMADSAEMAPPAPAPLAASAPQESAAPDFEVQTEEGAYATEFAVPGRTSVPSSSERTTLALGSTDAPAQLLTRTTPEVEQAAYLVARIGRPAGVWPAGPVALLQGKRFIGNGRLDFSNSNTNNSNTGSSGSGSSSSGGAGNATADATRTELAFGRDDKVLVHTAPVQDTRAAAGLTGASTERTVQSSYRIDNQHASAIELQVLHAAPVSRDAQIEVRSRYTPRPANLGFGGAPGTVLWQHNLAAGASASFAAEHVLRYPKDAQLQERR